MLKLVLISSIPGQDVRRCVENLVNHSSGHAFCARQGDQVLAAEDHFVDQASEFLERYKPAPISGYCLSDVLALPLEELSAACERAFESAVKVAVRQASQQKEASEFLLLPFHPILYHQVTREFVAPYQATNIRRVLAAEGLELDSIVSLHDDVYDIYRRLLRADRLFTPSITRKRRSAGEDKKSFSAREPLRDILEQLLVLSWRTHELSAAKSLGAGLQVKHRLFHQKGHLGALWRMIEAKLPVVYFSHPISQPRRDITGKSDPAKCKEPDSQRGRALINSCQELAAKIQHQLPVIEPTAIDELRIRMEWLDSATEAQLATHILPPLTERWELNDGPHVGGPPTSDLYTVPLLPVPDGAFRDLRCSEEGLARLRSSIDLLSEEIQRQINVRDHSLAEQCDIVVAYRPFSLPDSPEPTGGVRKEMDVVARKVALGKQVCRPALIVVHPESDEKHRRAVEFDLHWDRSVEKFSEESDLRKLQNLRERAREIIVNAPYRVDQAKISRDLEHELDTSGVQMKPRSDDSSMASVEHGRGQEAKKAFVELVVMHTAMTESVLHRDARQGGLANYVSMINADRFTQELGDVLKESTNTWKQKKQTH